MWLYQSSISDSLPEGSWKEKKLCPQNTWVTGFQVRMEPQQGSNYDDSALNGLRFRCTDLDTK